LTNYFSTSQKKALLISVITHPLFVPVAGFIMLNHYNTVSYEGRSLYLLLLVIIITTVALPSYFIFALKRGGHISGYELDSLKDRRIPLIFVSGILLFNYFLIVRSQLPHPFPLYFLCVSFTSLAAMCISLFYKISLHAIGIGFLTGLAPVFSVIGSSDMRWYLIMFLLGGGIVSLSRIVLGAHTRAQIYWGFLLGVLCAAGMMAFL